jgi:P27 family predicted phage terminase small subunit
MRGRKPTPTALRVLRGNPARRPLPVDEATPVVLASTAAPPEWLDDAAKHEWARVAPLLAKNGLLTELDSDALVAYCRAFADWREASARIKQFGMVVKTPSGYPMPSPYAPLAQKALVTMYRFMVEFGLTPASRTRVARATPKLEPHNPLDRFIRR